MNEATTQRPNVGRRAWGLAVLIVVNVACVVFFLGDVIADFESLTAGESTHLIVEAVVSIALLAGTAFLLAELRRLLQRNASMETGLRAARGEMMLVVDRFFDEWQLTHSERDVAFLVLKGLDNDDIATLRGTAGGTVRAQCARIYAKAGVSGRPQLLSVFMEELLSDTLVASSEAEPA